MSYAPESPHLSASLATSECGEAGGLAGVRGGQVCGVKLSVCTCACVCASFPRHARVGSCCVLTACMHATRAHIWRALRRGPRMCADMPCSRHMQEEKRCRFCSSPLTDWRSAIAEVQSDPSKAKPAIMAVVSALGTRIQCRARGTTEAQPADQQAHQGMNACIARCWRVRRSGGLPACQADRAAAQQLALASRHRCKRSFALRSDGIIQCMWFTIVFVRCSRARR